MEMQMISSRTNFLTFSKRISIEVAENVASTAINTKKMSVISFLLYEINFFSHNFRFFDSGNLL